MPTAVLHLRKVARRVRLEGPGASFKDMVALKGKPEHRRRHQQEDQSGGWRVPTSCRTWRTSTIQSSSATLEIAIRSVSRSTFVLPNKAASSRDSGPLFVAF